MLCTAFRRWGRGAVGGQRQVTGGRGGTGRTGRKVARERRGRWRAVTRSGGASEEAFLRRENSWSGRLPDSSPRD
ncbi:hypothetical protein CTZ40_36095 [Streptomyces rimosus]|nr:hypothetical protein CTZ40_36095 [Streptomyces rimosus]